MMYLPDVNCLLGFWGGGRVAVENIAAAAHSSSPFAVI